MDPEKDDIKKKEGIEKEVNQEDPLIPTNSNTLEQNLIDFVFMPLVIAVPTIIVYANDYITKQLNKTSQVLYDNYTIIQQTLEDLTNLI